MMQVQKNHGVAELRLGIWAPRLGGGGVSQYPRDPPSQRVGKQWYGPQPPPLGGRVGSPAGFPLLSTLSTKEVIPHKWIL